MEKHRQLFSAIAIILVTTALFVPVTTFKTVTAGELPDSSTASTSPIHRTFRLRGSATFNWNRTNPGPSISTVSGDLVTFLLISDEGLLHNWFLDFNNNFLADSTETATSSPDFSSTTTFLNYTFTPIIGTNIPSAGNSTYRCRLHPSTMFGTFRVLPEQIPVAISSMSTLDSSRVTTTGSLTIDTRTLTLTGSSTVTATDISTGATTFTKTYTVPSIQMRMGTTALEARFLLNAAVLPYALSSNILVQLKGLTASSTTQLTRQLDINLDGKLDIFDVSIALFVYGTRLGDPKYDPRSDFNADNKIDIFDISIIIFYYGASDLI